MSLVPRPSFEVKGQVPRLSSQTGSYFLLSVFSSHFISVFSQYIQAGPVTTAISAIAECHSIQTENTNSNDELCKGNLWITSP